jgi:hypothetical protein
MREARAHRIKPTPPTPYAPITPKYAHSLLVHLLDTDTCINLFHRRSPSVIQAITRREPNQVKLSAVTLAELEYGASKSRQREKNRIALLRFAAAFDVVAFDAAERLPRGGPAIDEGRVGPADRRPVNFGYSWL